MANQTDVVIICVSIGVAVGILLSACAFLAIRFCKRRSDNNQDIDNLHSSSSLPIHMNGPSACIDSSMSTSNSNVPHALPMVAKRNIYWSKQRNNFTSASGIQRYSYRDIQKATNDFTTVLGHGSFGPVYKATMPAGEVVAVKVLASNSSQGEKEFHTEVLLLSRLHHRHLVNLLGYCVDKGQFMLVYEYMRNGSLANLLYGEGIRNLSWEDRLQIALDISHGVEYLHEGAVPPVVHRDLKSANILLDGSMRAKVADFGLSKEEGFDGRKSNLKGTFGYMDPDYVSTSKFTKKSDIYSFGIITFELVTAINPQQGLMEYINLAIIGEDGKADWEEILDKELAGKCNLEEVKQLADVAYKCLHKIPRKRPSMSEVRQSISRIRQRHFTKENCMLSQGVDSSRVLEMIEVQHLMLNRITSRIDCTSPTVRVGPVAELACK